MLPRLIHVSKKVINSHCYHSNTSDFKPSNTTEVSGPRILKVQLLHRKSMQRLIAMGLHCNVEHKNALREKYYWRVKINGLSLSKKDRDDHLIHIGDYFTIDSPVFDTENGIYYYTKRAEVVKIEKRDKASEPPKVLKPRMHQIIKKNHEKWTKLVSLSITVTTKRFSRHIMYSDIPKKGHEAFKLLLQLSAPKKRCDPEYEGNRTLSDEATSV